MDLPEANTHSFIVKIWLEEIGDEARKATWRGHITHVPSGARRYLRELGDIVDFVVIYLEAMGVRPSRWAHVRRWLRRHKLFQRWGRRNNRRHNNT
jgi:hypothetical protein